MRIVSLVPSLTELVWWLGGRELLVGRTTFCTEPPEMASSIPSVGGTKTPDLDAIVALRPNLVIANQEENRREDVEALRERGLELLVTRIETLDEAVEAIRTIGGLVGVGARAEELVRSIEEARAEAPGNGPRVFVAVWGRPLMGLGGGTFGHAMLEAAGARNVLAAQRRYPVLSMEDVRAAAPDLILLPDEPYRFQPRHQAHFAAVAPTLLVDGKLLWWYGPRIPQSLATLRSVLRQPLGRGEARPT